MEQPTISIVDNPDAADRNAILYPLIAYCDDKVGPTNLRAFAIFLREKKTETIIGGLWGWSAHDWFVVELLFVPESLRGKGIGSSLIDKAERTAIERGCVGVWLDSFSFQAPKFYEKLGYVPFGTIPNYPKGSERIFFQKSLPPQSNP
jgi:GNAT superfamily N-acetyltransferase